MGLKEKIKNKYPKGTQFFDLVKNRLFISTGEISDYSYPDSNQAYIMVEFNEYGNKSARVFNNGQYAKIKSKIYELW